MKLSNDADHLLHVWINRRQDERRNSNESWERSLYEFKHLVGFLEWGGERLGKAFSNQLPQAYKHCSLSPTEALPVVNKLVCCLGQEVTTCPILSSLRETVIGEDTRGVEWYRTQLNKEKSALPEAEINNLMAVVCGWHIYEEATKNGEGFSVDTSEGYHLDETDRQFWRRTYESMAMGDPDDGAEEANGQAD